MAEVGVLNLTIKENSGQAVTGLGNLADALGRVKDAVKSASLTSFSNRLSKLADTINKEFGSSTIGKIQELGEQLSKMSGAGNITIRIKNVGSIIKASEAATKVNEATQALQTGMAGTNKAMEGFSTAGQSIQQVTDEFKEMQNVMSNSATRKVAQSMSQFDMSKLNMKDFISDPVTSLRERYKFMGEAAEECKNNVDAVIPSLRNYRDTVMQLESKRDIAGFSKKTGEELIGGLKEASREVENTIKESVQETKAAVDSTPVYQSLEEAARAMGISVEEATRQCESNLQVLRSSSGETRVFSSIEEAAQAMGITVEEATQQCRDNLQMLYSEANESTISFADQELIPTDQFIEAYSHLDYLKAKLADLISTLDAKRKIGLIDRDDIDKSVMEIIRLRNEIQKLEEEQANLRGSSGLAGTFNNLKNSIQELHVPFSGLVKQVTRMAKMRMIRAAIRMVSQGISEGTGNVYKYSQALGTSFSSAMDSAASSIQQVKNSVGAAIAPAIQAVIPLFIQLAGVAIDALNAVNQLFALLGGATSWTKAVYPTAQAFNDMNKAAKGAGGSAKEMLADFDELNVIASQGGGGGGAASDLGTSYEDMFEQMFTFNQKIKDLVDFVKENLDAILTTALAIGTAILSWKLATAFMDSLPLLSKIFGGLATAAVIAATLQLNWVFTNKYLDTGEVGWLIADALTTAVGATAAWAIAKHFIGGNAGAYAASITLLLSAVTGVIALLGHTDVSALSTESILTAIENALKVGAAAAILMKSVLHFGPGQSIAGGLAVAVATFGVIIGLKTVLDPNIETFSLDHIKATVLAALAVGAGVGFLAENPMVGAGAALITVGVTIGLKAAIDPNIETFSGESIMTALGSALAVGLGTVMVGGSLAMAGGAALFAVAAYFAIKLITSKSLTKVEWGSIDLTEDEIKQYVKNKFHFDVEAELKIIDTNITNSRTARSHLDGAISEFNQSLKKITLDVDTSDEAYNDAITKFGELKTKLDSWLSSDQAMLTAYFKILPYDKETQEGMVSDIFLADQQLSDYFTSIGQQMADLFDQGMKSEWKNNEKEQILALMEHIENITQNAEDLYQQYKLELGSSHLLSDFSEETASGVLAEQKKMLEDYRTEAEKINNELYDSMLKKAAYAESAGLVDENGLPLADTYKKAAEDLLNGFDEAYNAKLKDTKENMKTEWIAALKDVYGEEYNKKLTQLLRKNNDYFIENLKYNFKKSETDGKKALMKSLDEILKVSGITKEAAELFGITGYDLLSADMKKQFYDSVYKAIGVDAISLLKDTLNIPAGELFSLIEWEKIEGEQRQSLIDTLNNAYGEDVVKEILEKYGIEINQYLADGLENKGAIINALSGIEDTLVKGGLSSQYILDNWDLYAPAIGGKTTEEALEIIKTVIKTAGTDSKFILENWNLIAPTVEEYGLENSLIMIKDVASTSGLDIKTVISNWDLIAPIVERDGITDSLATIKEVVNKTGVDSRTILSHWDLIAPLVDQYGITASMNSIKRLAQAAGVDVDTILDNWDLYAPLVMSQGLENSLNYLTKLMQTTGHDSEYILQHWNLVAPTVNHLGFDNTIAAIKQISKTSGVDIKSIVANWNLIAPLIDENNVDKSVDEIGKTIKDNESNWQQILKGKLETSKVTMPTDFVSEAQQKVAEAASSLQAAAKAYSIVFPVGVKSDGSSVSTAVHDTKEGGKYISLDTKPGYTFAEGGFPLKGSIFVANEDGPEMIGTIGSRSAVANTEQIVSGIAIGVSEANSEQNALLKEQNTLLRQILRKDNSVRIGASAALGRVAKQSIEMYGTVGG